MSQQEVQQLRPDQLESIENLKVRIDNDDVVVIDVRDPDQVERSGKIEATRWLNIPFVEVETALKMSPTDFESKYKIAKPDQDDGHQMLFHCGKGGRGTKAVLVAHNLGYTKSKNLDGGQSTWKRSF